MLSGPATPAVSSPRTTSGSSGRLGPLSHSGAHSAFRNGRYTHHTPTSAPTTAKTSSTFTSMRQSGIGALTTYFGRDGAAGALAGSTSVYGPRTAPRTRATGSLEG